MKRLGLTLVAALCLAATTFAAGNQPTTARKIKKQNCATLFMVT